MKTYLRILSYAGPIRRLISFYLLTTALATFFGLVNLSLLVPLLEVLFGKNEVSDTLTAIPKPVFSISLAYLKGLFNYHFLHVIASHGRLSALYFVCIILTTSVLLTNLFRYLAEIVVAAIHINVVHNLRKELFDKVTCLHLGYFTNQKKGDIIARLTSDVQEVEHAITDTFRVLFKEPITIISFFIVLFHISTQLTLLALLSLPLIGGGIIALVRRVLKKATQSQAALGRLTSIVEETLGGMHVITAFAARLYASEKFKQENKSYAQINFSMFLKKSLIPLLSEFLGVLVMTLLLVCGGKMVLLNPSTFTASTFIPYIIIFAQVLVPIKSISKSLSNIQRGLAAGERIFVLADTVPTILNKPGAQKIKTLYQGITFSEVSFAYERKPVLKYLNLAIAPGRKIALVGSSGSGKSTIIHLLNRLYDATQGTIEIDGLSIQDYDVESLRNFISVVPQETMLFHDTVFNNIAFGRPEASKEVVIEAAKIAHAHDFIKTLPLGYQTVIGGQGTKLSSGQAQRIGIARAVLSKPSVLILDEATSALDRPSESLVQGALDQMMKGKTLLVAAHRLGSIWNADEILVLDAGEVVERGTHETLVQQEGLYKRLIIRE